MRSIVSSGILQELNYSRYKACVNLELPPVHIYQILYKLVARFQ